MHYKTKNLCDLLYLIFTLLQWSETEPTISPRYACALVSFPSLNLLIAAPESNALIGFLCLGLWLHNRFQNLHTIVFRPDRILTKRIPYSLKTHVIDPV